MILENGIVRTGDPRLPVVRALAIADGLVAGGVDVREGGASRVSGERVDLAGRCVVPGFTDAHLHFLEWALALRRLDLAGTRSRAAVLERVAAAAKAGEGWLLGAGWRDAHWPGGDASPDRASLDAVSAGRPAALVAHDHHTIWFNSAGLSALGVPDMPVVERDGAGEPTGILREDAAWDLWGRIPSPPEHELDEAVRSAMRVAHARGVVGVHDFQRDLGLGCWQRLHADGRLSLRVWASLPAARLDWALALGLRSGFGDSWLQIGPVKAFADGTLGSRTAAMIEPFSDGGTGLALLEPGELRDLVRRASEGGLDVAVHAIGDAANRRVLDAFEAERDVWQPRGLRPRIEHCQLVDPDDAARFGALGVTASMQPSHWPSDAEVARAAWGDRVSSAYAWGTLASARGADLPGLRRTDRARCPARRRSGSRDP